MPRVCRCLHPQTELRESQLEAVPNPRGFGWKPDTGINLRHVM